MEDNPDINTNENNIEQNIEINDEINNFGELDDEEDKNDDIIQDLIKQGKYFDVIKYLESKDNKGKNNKENDNEQELVIIPADDISDLHDDNDSNKNEDEEKENKNEEIKDKTDENKIKDNNDNNINDKNNDNNESKNENEIKEKNTNTIINKENINAQKEINSEQNTNNINNNIINDKEEENISPKDLIKNIINSENIKQKKSISSNNSSKSISLLHLSFEEEREANNYYEERLKEIQQERKIFLEKHNLDGNPDNNMENNIEILTKELAELNELESDENADLNGIEQMNEMYQMLQEDKEGNYLQEKERERLFPFYNKALCNIKEEIKNEYFKSTNFNNIRNNFFINSKILDEKNLIKRKNYNSNKYNIESPLSIFDELKFEKSDIKGLDYDEYLDDFLEDKNKKNNANIKILKNNYIKIEKNFSNFKKNKNKIKKDLINIKPKEIFLTKKEKKFDDEKYEINVEEIYNKYKDSIENLETNSGVENFNEFYLDNFATKNDIFNFNDYSIDLDLDEDIKKEIINPNKPGQNNLEDKDKENYYLKINNNRTFNDSILNNYSLLRFINLENNNLSKFPDLTKCANIYSINLNNNKITKIDKINNLIFLEKLSLTNNLISSIDNCFINNKHLRFLYLGKNKISSIKNLSQNIPFIEELILCQNNIDVLPEKIFFPHLKFLDLNENKISINNSNLFFICPSLEKLLLLGNNINEFGSKNLIKYCPKLKEIDLSFNKFNNIIELVQLFSINSCWNNNLEMINIIGNSFFNSNKNKEIFYFLIKKFCPSIKYINNDEIKKANKINENYNINNNISLNTNNIYPNINLSESYINIYNSENLFMKYFTSVYFTNKIFDTFNININNNLKTNNVQLFSLINKTYYQFKLSHFKSQLDIYKTNLGFFSYQSNFQFSDLLIYLYKFKSRMNFIKSTIPLIVKRTLFRRMKIIKIQQHYKLRILRKKLAAIVIPDDEDDHAEDLLDFFNKENKETDEVKFDDEDLDKKIEEIGKKIENNIEKNKNKNKSKNYVLEVIKEEKEKDLDTQAGINLDKIPDLNISDDDIKDINEIISEDLLMNNNNKDNKDMNIINKNTNEKIKDINNKINNSNKTILNNNNIINPKKEIISINKGKEKDSLIEKLLSNPKYNTSNNSKLHPNRLAPITNASKNPIIPQISSITKNNIPNTNIPNTSNNIINQININYNFENIDFLKRGLGIEQKSNKISFYSDTGPKKPQNRNKIHIKDDKHFGKYININSQINIPSEKKGEKPKPKRPESKGVFLPQINSNLNMSTTTLSNETNSVFSNMTTGKKMIKANNNKKNEEMHVDKKCREIIEKAKAEWNFTNKEIENMLVKKIMKNYNRGKNHAKKYG